MPYQDYVGRTETRDDTVWPPLVRGLAATVDVAPPADGTLPPLWHWVLFQDWVPAATLGPDGHPRRGGFLLPVDDAWPRMWAGGRLRFPGRLVLGDAVRRVSTIRRIEEKTGASGRLLFVTVEHVVSGPAGPAVIEEQDIVYRADDNRAARPDSPEAPPPAGAIVGTVRPDAVLLFRYSALTGNGHRIHYDQEYATQMEGYPGLVVHGPLQATLLAGHAARVAPGARIAAFTFRGRRPAFHDVALTLAGWREGDTMRLETRAPIGVVCMRAEATLG